MTKNIMCKFVILLFFKIIFGTYDAGEWLIYNLKTSDSRHLINISFHLALFCSS